MAKKSRPGPGLSPEDTELFRAAVSKVNRLDQEPRALQPRQKRPKNRSPQTDQRAAQGISGEEGELFYRANLPAGAFKELRQGYFRPSATIDLHGQTVAQAESALLDFIQIHTDFNLKCLLVITGKGSHSPEGYSPVRFAALDLLQKQPWIHAYCWACPKDGGTGAFYVLTRKGRS
jgi:DNA-nicking Smr family endonuclease